MFTPALLLVGIFAGEAAQPALPADARLDPKRARLEAIVGRADASGLPVDLLVSKVREGLAKGIDLDRIEAIVSRLAEHLEAAGRFVDVRRPGQPPARALVRALAEARLGGLDLNAADPLVREPRPPADSARGVAVLADLSSRGYPAARAGALVDDVLARDATAIARLPSALDEIRLQSALTHTETLDALARGLTGAASFQAACARAMSNGRPSGTGDRSGFGRGKRRAEPRAARPATQIDPGLGPPPPGGLVRTYPAS